MSGCPGRGLRRGLRAPDLPAGQWLVWLGLCRGVGRLSRRPGPPSRGKSQTVVPACMDACASAAKTVTRTKNKYLPSSAAVGLEGRRVRHGEFVLDLDFWVQIDSVKQPIKSKFVGPGNMSHCGTSSLNKSLDHCFVVLKHIQRSFWMRRFDV